jgi:hypothetical protein
VSPTVLQSGPYRFFFFASDRLEPPHIHVKRDKKLAKFWLAPVREAVQLWIQPAGTESNHRNRSRQRTGSPEGLA